MTPPITTKKKILRVRLSIKGRPLKSYVFEKDVVSIGRSPDTDIFLDNQGVSREHLRIEMTPDGGYQAIDMGSANGTLLNQEPLKKANLAADDVLQIGKFTLWIGLEDDRRTDPPADRHETAFAPPHEGTMVLSTDDLDRMLQHAREEQAATAECDRRPIERTDSPVGNSSRSAFIVGVLIAFFLGAVAGAGALRFLTH
jgi:predicted component of type VI protein secretion system